MSLYIHVMHQSVPAVPIPPPLAGMSGAFFLLSLTGPGISLPQGICQPMIFMSQYCHFLLVITSLGKFNLALITRMKVSPKTKKLTYMYFFLPYLGGICQVVL